MYTVTSSTRTRSENRVGSEGVREWREESRDSRDMFIYLYVHLAPDGP